MRIKNLDELIGKKVVVAADFGTMGYLIAERHLAARQLAAVGIVQGYVPGHGGDIVYVLQEDTKIDQEPIGVYNHLNELEFYSDEVLLFVKKKAEQVKILTELTKELKEKKFK